MSGPGMMGLPRVFAQAGLIPSVVTIVWIAITSSLCGSFLADSISSIPGNKSFDKQIQFSSAFEILAGRNWFILAEICFVLSCLVQACAGIVECAHSLDGFIASFLVGKTYGLQLYPEVTFVTWSSSGCYGDGAGQVSDFPAHPEMNIKRSLIYLHIICMHQ
jgi:amino acid permease